MSLFAGVVMPDEHFQKILKWLSQLEKLTTSIIMLLMRIAGATSVGIFLYCHFAERNRAEELRLSPAGRKHRLPENASHCYQSTGVT